MDGFLALVPAVFLVLPGPARAQEPARADPQPAAAPSAESRPDSEEPQPDSRAERLRRQRRAKVTHPAGQSPTERLAVYLEDRARYGLLNLNLPFDTYFTPGSVRAGAGFLAGRLNYWNIGRARAPVTVYASAGYSQKQYQSYNLRVGRIPHRQGRQPPKTVGLENRGPYTPVGSDQALSATGLYLFANLRYHDFTEERFFGVGKGSRQDDESNYRLKEVVCEGVLQYRFRPEAVGSIRFGYLEAEVLEGRSSLLPSIEEVFDAASAPGLVKHPDYLFGTAELLVDWRDNPGNTHRGGSIAVAVSRFDGREGMGYHFNRLAVEARQFLPLFSPRRRLALRLGLLISDPDDECRIPFYMQETLGGSRALRGFGGFRFRGDDILLLQAEYRWEPTRALQFVLFFDAGTTPLAAEAFEVDDLETSFGAGVRITTATATFLRFEIAKSSEATRFVVAFGESF